MSIHSLIFHSSWKPQIHKVGSLVCVTVSYSRHLTNICSFDEGHWPNNFKPTTKYLSMGSRSVPNFKIWIQALWSHQRILRAWSVVKLIFQSHPHNLWFRESYTWLPCLIPLFWIHSFVVTNIGCTEDRYEREVNIM